MDDFPIKAEMSEELYRKRKIRFNCDEGVNTDEDKIYIGPSIEGPDVEYIERVGGKVSDRKPSFARQ